MKVSDRMILASHALGARPLRGLSYDDPEEPQGIGFKVDPYLFLI